MTLADGRLLSAGAVINATGAYGPRSLSEAPELSDLAGRMETGGPRIERMDHSLGDHPIGTELGDLTNLFPLVSQEIGAAPPRRPIPPPIEQPPGPLSMLPRNRRKCQTRR